MNWYGWTATCDEERRRTHTEESVEDGYAREKEERTTENKMERHVPRRLENWRARRCTEGHGIGRSPVIPVILYDGKSRGNRRMKARRHTS